MIEVVLPSLGKGFAISANQRLKEKHCIPAAANQCYWKQPLVVKALPGGWLCGPKRACSHSHVCSKGLNGSLFHLHDRSCPAVSGQRICNFCKPKSTRKTLHSSSCQPMLLKATTCGKSSSITRVLRCKLQCPEHCPWRFSQMWDTSFGRRR